ncbi:Glycoside hydrolase family 5 [Neofusicoccum parvum]|uniref:Glycoside hydrolase family 5 n=1 Tax=Neofusicoccum parvum TaxID=310453 RepID=A0ACB5S2N5_9PEZI|nr:Glycoside hydrolase family 5 [Neofusicoccum parvum]
MARFILFLLATLFALTQAHPSPTDGALIVQAAASPFLLGVNLGGWLVLEPFLTPELFAANGAVDQWTFDQQAGSENVLRHHWDTFCTEADIQKLASYGVNAVRIGIGFWAYDNAGTPYHSGADAYLSKAIQWAKNAGILVVIELHGAPGSQNGDWQTGSGNLDRTTNVLKIIAQKYGTKELANTVVAIELVNEPTNTLPNTLQTTKSWTKTAYGAVRAAASNKNLRIVMHDQNLDQPGHIKKVCKFATEQLAFAKKNSLPTHVGEFSGNTFICVNPDGSTFADPEGTGKICRAKGCQCETDGGIDVNEWSDALTRQVRRYIEAQLYVYEEYAGGWFFWNFKGPGSWGFMAGIEKGFIPKPLADRHYPNPCA